MKFVKNRLPPKDTAPRVCAVIVTYNRLGLLKDALAAVRHQSRRPDTIIVVDNGSSDGTGLWLAAQTDAAFHVITQPNLGGSGGFYTGMLAAYETGADWLWCMDDDTIPDRDCLVQILAA